MREAFELRSSPALGFAAVKIAGRFEIYDERETDPGRGGRFVIQSGDAPMEICAGDDLSARQLSRSKIMGRLTA